MRILSLFIFWGYSYEGEDLNQAVWWSIAASGIKDLQDNQGLGIVGGESVIQQRLCVHLPHATRLARVQYLPFRTAHAAWEPMLS